MEQRRLRLGDILDDYCPRERRVTNHAVVAMIEEDVKQTRCTTCDAEHAYKGGKEPRRRKKDSAAGLYQEVLAGMPEVTGIPPAPIPEPPAPELPTIEAAAVEPDEPPAPVQPEEEEVEEPRSEGDDGPFHRRLIRATLPRPEGQKEVRQVPDFTIRQNGRQSTGSGRNGHNPFRHGSRMRGPGDHSNGDRPFGGGRRFGPSTGGGNAGPGGRGRGAGRPGFGGPSTGSGRGPSTGSGRGPSTGSGRGPSAGPRGRKRSR